MLNKANYQGNDVVNFTDSSILRMRVIEHKWFEYGLDDEGRTLPKTVSTKEYSTEWGLSVDLFYLANDAKNSNLYKKYKQLAAKENGIIIVGRLGAYQYYEVL